MVDLILCPWVEEGEVDGEGGRNGNTTFSESLMLQQILEGKMFTIIKFS